MGSSLVFLSSRLSPSRWLHLREIAIGLLPEGEGDIFVLYHVLDTILHGQYQQDKEVSQEDRPEDWEVEDLKEGHDEAGDDGAEGADPKLELWQFSSEGSVFATLRRGQTALRVRIYGWRQKVDDQVQQVNPKAVGHDVKAFLHENSHGVSHQRKGQQNPSSSDPDNCIVQPTPDYSLGCQQLRYSSWLKGAGQTFTGPVTH
mmetsp:Transcript_25618/g.56493  ORF Transcript_25618/g.56493 Transcript_25618/m.56493 type:complete len:202 (+) Transcript_25618:164-769(+)